MAVVRHAQAEMLAREAIVLDLGDLSRQAAALRAKAQAEADQIIAEGKAERARLIEGAEAMGFEQGFARGLAEGRAQGVEEGRQTAIADVRREVEPLGAAWAQGLEAFEQAREASRKSAAMDLVALAQAVARRVTHQVVTLHPEAAQDQLAHVLALVLEPSGITIEVHPADVALCQAVLPGLIEGRGEGSEIRVRASDDLARGSVVVRTGRGVIDASVDGQLDRLAAAMVGPVRPKGLVEASSGASAGSA